MDGKSENLKNGVFVFKEVSNISKMSLEIDDYRREYRYIRNFKFGIFN